MAFVFSSLRSAARAVASTVSLVAAASLAGCAPETQPHVLNSPSPVEESAAPTATAPTETAPTETAPPYSTDLQLSEEEKKAVDEALLSLDRYVQISNEVFRAGGEGAEKFDEVAKDSMLISLQDESEGLKQDDARMTGEFRLDNIAVHDVNLDLSDDTAIAFVNFHTCVPVDEYSYTDLGDESADDGAEDFDTYEMIIAEYDEEWFISEQYLWTSGCDI